MKTAIVDLDGTLVSCNSFTKFVKFLFHKYPSLRLRLAAIVLRRKLRLISHHQAKEEIINQVLPVISAKELSEFVDSLIQYINNGVVDMTANFPRRILATAAPEIYVKIIAQRMGFSEYCATRPGLPENCGEEKLRNVLKLGVIFDGNTLVVTDSYDDAPLMKANPRGINRIV